MAEVLVTLGIIGVVAAMTLPSLIANKQKKELQTALKKNYSVISEALLRMSNDLGETVNPHDYNNQAFVITYKNYLNWVWYCGMQGCIGRSTNEAGELTNIIKNYKTYNKSKNVETNYFDDGQMVLNDGAFILVENPATSIGLEQVFITVDVNGYKKRPNIWGQDLFTFQLTDDGKLIPMGADETKYKADVYCNKNSTDGLNGIGCAYLALTDENYWKNLP